MAAIEKGFHDLCSSRYNSAIILTIYEIFFNSYNLSTSKQPF
jgi:hypothetical protein